MARTFRLLNLSDLHLRDPDNPDRFCYCDERVFEQVACIACLWKDDLDAILVSGDLADSGSFKDLESATGLVLGPPGYPDPWMNGRRPTLQGAGKPIVIVPGNHDRYDRPKPGSVGHTGFDTAFKSLWTEGLGGVQCHFLPDHRSPELSIICADLSLTSRTHARGSLLAYWGQGMAYPDRLDILEAKTKTVLDGSIPVLWMVHFSPHVSHDQGDLQLLNSSALLQRARSTGVKHIICGHLHEKKPPYRSPVEPAVEIFCAASSCCEPRDDCMIHVLTITVEGRDMEVVRSDYEYIRDENLESSSTGQFTPKIWPSPPRQEPRGSKWYSGLRRWCTYARALWPW